MQKMFNVSLFELDENYQNEKLKLLHSMNSTLQHMTNQLELFCSHAEEAKNPSNNSLSTIDQLLLPSNGDFCTAQDENFFVNDTYSLLNQALDSSSYQSPFSTRDEQTNKHELLDLKQEELDTRDTSSRQSNVNRRKVGKRNKQQRLFNTFVRDSINTILGAEYMRTHDVQDIDNEIMEKIKTEALHGYLPDNTRPRRAWHLAKASLRTLKRTLNKKYQYS